MTTYSTNLGRRRFLAGLSALGCSLAVAQRGPGAQSGMRLVLLGTQGGPNFNSLRNECANAIVVGSRVYVVDCGYGAMGALKESGLGIRGIGNVFLTHLHDDHTADLAALISHQWTDGRVDPNLIIGPYGTEALVQAALDFAAANTAIRLADEDRSVLPGDIFSGRDIAAATTPTEIFADDAVTVSSVENTHFPESARAAVPYRSVSYRFDSRDRSIAFSGDTAYSENLVHLAEGADVLVCEAMDVRVTRDNFEQRVAAGAYKDNAEGVWKHIVGTHSSTEDAGRMAAEAGVGTLVLTHLLPGGLVDLPDEAYVEGVRMHFDGEVIVGRDLMEI